MITIKNRVTHEPRSPKTAAVSPLRKAIESFGQAHPAQTKTGSTRPRPLSEMVGFPRDEASDPVTRAVVRGCVASLGGPQTILQTLTKLAASCTYDGFTREQWSAVPQLVATRYKQAADIKKTLSKVVKYLPCEDPGYGFVFWNPSTKSVWAVLSDSDTEQTAQKWHNALKALSGVDNVRVESEAGPYGDDDWIQIKSAAALSWLDKPYQLAGKLTGGPSPLSNSIVSGMLGTAAGYGTGWLAEQLLPEQYFEPGKLRRTGAMVGGAAGAAAHVPEWMAQSSMNREGDLQAGRKPSAHLGRSLLGPAYQQHSPDEINGAKLFDSSRGVSLQRAKQSLAEYPMPGPMFMDSAAKFVKTAFGDSGFAGSRGVPMRPVPVDAFNRAIWNDVHNTNGSSSRDTRYGTRSQFGDNSEPLHTPPVVAAATTGLVSGVQQMYGGAPALSPSHFMHGLATAGVDMATARVAGGVLGALGGLKPEGQRKLQDMGIWSGMIRGVVGSIFNR